MPIKYDLTERSVFNLFRTGNGKDTSKIGPISSFHTTSTQSNRSASGKAVLQSISIGPTRLHRGASLGDGLGVLISHQAFRPEEVDKPFSLWGRDILRKLEKKAILKMTCTDMRIVKPFY